MLDGHLTDDWWTDDFTLPELQSLQIKQDQAPGRIKTVDFYFSFPTLYDIIEYGLAFNLEHKGSRNPDRRIAGLLIEAKSAELYRQDYNLEIGDTILGVLQKYGLDSVKGC